MKIRRILLVDGSRLLREVMKRVIEKSADLEVVGEVADLKNILPVIENTQPDWIVYFSSPDSRIPEILEKIMIKKMPSIRILGISIDGKHVKMEWIGLREKQMIDSSLEELTELLRSNLLNEEGDG